jgi:hypothetical protein
VWHFPWSNSPVSHRLRYFQGFRGLFFFDVLWYMPQSVRLGHLHEQEDALFTDREQKLVNWLWKRKTATMRQMRRQFQVSPMTVFRALKKHGYHTRYNHNAAYYTLADTPQFDDWGLRAYRNVRFSRAAT